MQNTKNELYANWKTQEDLLQQYRSLGITHQALIAACVVFLLTTFDSNFSAYKGIFFNSLRDDIVFSEVIVKLALYFILIYMGWRSTDNFIEITSNRARNVSFLQNLIMLVESGRFQTEMKNAGISQPYPIFALFTYFQRGKDVKNIDVFPLKYSDELDKFMEKMHISAGAPGRHHMTRGYLKTEIFRIFYVFWIASITYMLVVIINLVLHA